MEQIRKCQTLFYGGYCYLGIKFLAYYFSRAFCAAKKNSVSTLKAELLSFALATPRNFMYHGDVLRILDELNAVSYRQYRLNMLIGMKSFFSATANPHYVLSADDRFKLEMMQLILRTCGISPHDICQHLVNDLTTH